MIDELNLPIEEFKPREIEIIDLMAQGLSNQEIADQLFITKGTVRWYNKIIYSKLGTSRRTEAIAVAREMGLIGNEASSEAEPSFSIQPKLPITTGPFIGRNAELVEISELLSNPDIRLLSIVGTGGMGKSRLSLELGHLIQTNYDHGVIFVDLTSARNPDNIPQITLSALNLSTNGNQSPEEVILNYCRAKELLLIFDNFEHVLTGARFLTDILENAPNVQILTTTRAQLNLRVETAYYLQPVIESGAELFSEVARMMRPTIEIGADEQADIQHIVEAVGGLPLALILAANWVDMLSIAEIVAEIEASLDFLSAEMGDVPERQQSMYAVIDPTWTRLTEQEQKAFMWASVFRGGFTREAFQQVTGASLRTIQTLMHRSLISAGHGRRYDMHPLLRQYASEKLEASGLFAEAQQAHLKTFLTYAQTQADRMYDGQHYLDSLEKLDIEQDNFRTALDWSMNGYATQSGIALILTLCDFWAIRSQRIEGIYYLEQVLNHEQQAALYERLGAYQIRLGKPDSAQASLQKAITLATEANQPDILARAYRLVGTYLTDTNPEQAHKLIEKSLMINQDLNLSREVAHCYVLFGLAVADFEDKPLEALDYFQQAMTIYEELGDLQGISMVIYNMGRIYIKDGHIQRAREYYERSLTIKQQIGDRAGAARRLSVLAEMDILEEEYEQARAYIAESRIICAEIGDQQRLGEVLRTKGFLHIIMAEYSQAQAVLEQGLELALNLKSYSLIISFYSYIGLLFLVQKQVQKAEPYIVKAIETDTMTSQPPWLSIVTYANLLWYENDINACLPVLAILFHHRNTSTSQDAGVIKYFLEPLIYRVQKQIGETAWQNTLEDARNITLEQIFRQIIDTLILE